jgi:subtilisin-like proprotein convertase family protein
MLLRFVPQTFLKLAAIFWVFGAAARAAQMGSGTAVTLSEGGVAQRFEIAQDELYVVTADGFRIESIDPAEFQLKSRRLGPTPGRVEPVLYPVGAARSDATRRTLTSELLVELSPDADPSSVAAAVPGVRFVRRMDYAPRLALFEAPEPLDALGIAVRLRQQPGVRRVENQLGRHFRTELIPNDPFFRVQWHLRATPLNVGIEGIDTLVTNVWDEFRGGGMIIGVIDDGVEMTHPDLAPNMHPTLRYDFFSDDPDPTPTMATNGHGTAVAGLAAARGNNGEGVTGVAFEAQIAPFRLITGGALTDRQIGDALAYSNNVIHVKNNSWGARTVNELRRNGLATELAIEAAAETGRGGRGTVLVFSSGNDGDDGDDVNYNGFKNNRRLFVIGSMAREGTRSLFSTPGAALIGCTLGGSQGFASLTTTDRVGNNGYNTQTTRADLTNRSYSTYFTGTSAAAPIASGIVALMLQANPSLTWRDVQEILTRSALRLPLGNAGYRTNGAGLAFHHEFGAGLLRAEPAIALARTWRNLGPETSRIVTRRGLGLAVPDRSTNGVEAVFQSAGSPLRIETVEVTVDVTHQRRGELQIQLISPSGMVSRLAERHADTNSDYAQWTFQTRFHRGESSLGDWRIKVADVGTNVAGGVFQSASIQFFGTALSPVVFSSAGFVEESGLANGDGAADPGETVAERIVVRNDGDAAITNATVTLRPSTPDVTVLDGTWTVPVLGAGSSATNLMRYQLGTNVPCASSAVLQVVVGADSMTTTNELRRSVGLVTESDRTTNRYEASLGLPLPLPDLQTRVSTNVIAAGASATVDDMEVAIRLNHTAVIDLVLSLIHPDGTEVTLVDHRGDNEANLGTGRCGIDLVPMTLSDSATAVLDVGPGLAPFAGRYRPDQPLRAFRGKPVAGAWRLRVIDEYRVDSGKLLCWSLNVTSVNAATNCVTFIGQPSAAPRVEGIDLVAGGSLRIRASGTAGRPAVLERSLNLSAWAGVQTNTPAGAQFEFTEVPAAAQGFYRIRQ